MSKEKKAKLVKEITITTHKTLNIPTEAINVLIKENNPDNIGIGGKLLSDR
jgi:4-oxalocrotonate tautomerase